MDEKKCSEERANMPHFCIKERRKDKNKYLHVLAYAKATLEGYPENVNCDSL